MKKMMKNFDIIVGSGVGSAGQASSSQETTMTPQDTVTLCICGDSNCTIPYGSCHCGCGGKTPIASYNKTHRFIKMGEPFRFLVGHKYKLVTPPPPTDGICVCGDSNCQIPRGICHCGCGQQVSTAKESKKGKNKRGTYNKFTYHHHGNRLIRIAVMMEQPETVYRRNPNPSPKDIDRFWSKVDKSSGHGPQGDCWIWMAAKSSTGYGIFGVPEGTFLAHRFSMLVGNGSLPVNLMVLHKCDNPPCVNPSHLFMGTAADNIRDCHNKGRHNVDYSLISGENHWSSKLTDQQVFEIRSLYKPTGHGYTEVGKRYGITGEHVSAILNGKTWKHMLGEEF